MSLPLKPEDRAGDDGDTAIAVELETLGEIEAKVLMMNGYLGEVRQAIREAKGLTDSPRMNRLLNRALRASDDGLREGLAVVARARSL